MILAIAAALADEPVEVWPEEAGYAETQPMPGVALSDPPEWCTDAGPLSRSDAAWCGSVPKVCTGLQESCKKTPVPEVKRSTPQPRRVAAPPQEAQFVVVGGQRVLLGVLVGLVLMAVAGWFFGPKEDLPELTEKDEGPGSAPAPVFVPRREDELLAAARRAVQDGRHGEALLLLRAAVVRALERSGTLAADPGRTDRETVRALASEPELAAPVKVVASALERQRYAALPVDRQTLDAAFSATQRILTRLGMVAVLLGIGVAHAGPADQEHLQRWLQDNGFAAAPATDFSEDSGLFLWVPSGWTTESDVARARLAAEKGAAVLVVADADVLAMFPEVEGLGQAKGTIAPPDAKADAFTLPRPTWTFDGVPADSVLLVDSAGEPVAVRAHVGAGELVFFGNPHFFDDASLLDATNAAVLGKLLRGFESRHPVVWVLTLEAPAGTPLRSMVAAGLGPILAQLGLVWAFWAWSRGRRFAGPVGVLDDARRDFRGHLDAVASLYRAVNATRSGAAASIGRSFHLLRERTRAPEAALVAAVADRSGESRERVATLFSLARRILGDPGGLSGGADHPVQEELWTLVERTRRRDGSAASPHGSRRSRPRSAG